MILVDEPVFVGPFALHLFRQPDDAPMVDGGTIDRTELDNAAVVRVLQVASAHVAGVAPATHLAAAVRALEETARQRRFGAFALRIPGTSRALMVGTTLLRQPPPSSPSAAVRMIRDRIAGAIFGTGPPKQPTSDADDGTDDPEEAAALQRDSEGEAMPPRGYL